MREAGMKEIVLLALFASGCGGGYTETLHLLQPHHQPQALRMPFSLDDTIYFLPLRMVTTRHPSSQTLPELERHLREPLIRSSAARICRSALAMILQLFLSSRVGA